MNEPLTADNCSTIQKALENTTSAQHARFINEWYPRLMPKTLSNACFVDTRWLSIWFDMPVIEINRIVLQNLEEKAFKFVYNARYIKLNILGLLQLCDTIGSQRSLVFKARVKKWLPTLLKVCNRNRI